MGGLKGVEELWKVELVGMEKGEDWKECDEEMVKEVEGVVEKVEVGYGMVGVCGGEMSFRGGVWLELEV